MSVTLVNSLSEFREIIERDEYAIFDFWATWCGPCRFISPIFEELSKKFTNIKYYKVDVDDQPDIAQEVGVRAMPTFAVFKKGVKVDDLVGADAKALTLLVEKASA